MSWIGIAQNLAAFLQGQFALIVIGALVTVFGLNAMVHHRWGQFASVIGGGAVAVSAPWFVSTFLAG